jgi:hypothetical protein
MPNIQDHMKCIPGANNPFMVFANPGRPACQVCGHSQFIHVVPGKCFGCADMSLSTPAHYVGEIAADEGIRQIARHIADSMIEDARTSPGPIAWVTSNNMFPALRNYNGAEQVWQLNDGEGWPFLCEELERLLCDASVYLASPEYDNSLYVVDLARFEVLEDDEITGDSLEDEWRSIKPAGEYSAPWRG